MTTPSPWRSHWAISVPSSSGSISGTSRLGRQAAGAACAKSRTWSPAHVTVSNGVACGCELRPTRTRHCCSGVWREGNAAMNVFADIKADASHDADELWFKDAIIYQLHVKAFLDSNNDGMGDFAGLTQKLDYLQDLGVTALWLLPFYPSPQRDDGYDIADYRNIHPDFGTLHDFRRFMQEARRRR